MLFRHFSKVEIPGLLNLSKSIGEAKDEMKEFKVTIAKLLANAQANSSSVVNITNVLKEPAEDAKEIEPKLRTRKEQGKESTQSDKVLRFIEEKEYDAAYAILRKMIQTILLEILRIKDPEIDLRQSSWPYLIKEVRKMVILPPELIDALYLVRSTANTILNSSQCDANISHSEAATIANLGLKALSELEVTKNYLIENKEYFTGWD
ncbi:MAG: hypothetical protein ABSF65_00015 [Candidatus Bathyarchaeia archaeon]